MKTWILHTLILLMVSGGATVWAGENEDETTSEAGFVHRGQAYTQAAGSPTCDCNTTEEAAKRARAKAVADAVLSEQGKLPELNSPDSVN